MKRYSFLEIFIGVFIILLVLFSSLYFFSIKKISSSNFPSYILKVDFKNIDGISVNSDVQISGVKVGYVKNLKLESDYFVSLELAIKKNIKIPEDSSASIVSSNFFAPKYLSIDPGISKNFLLEGQKIVFSNTQMGLDDIINKIIYSITMNKSK